ncbi:hypothetical protein FOA52_004573 [Chlamydomonas sp. UWO 241]|nr:hypothetical protein FOA52_004573 [Chlamydomonas sp. UWO 241]
MRRLEALWRDTNFRDPEETSWAGLLLSPQRRLQNWEDNDPQTNAILVLGSCTLVLFAGCMSGLTLGLLSMDLVDLEVLKRSGREHEKAYAENILPIVKNAHYLLVTLLLCNAMAMETLPILLNKMVHESVAIIISVTAVLFFGEIIPQAICSKHGLMIGSMFARPVRILMIVTAPISWPVSKVLDRVLGGDHASLFRRKQLKALLAIHGQEEGFGGKLSSDEIQIITGALDLTTKTAFHAMTPIEKVFMLSTTQRLDDSTVEAIMASKPYSRLPVYRGSNKRDIVGLILVKELLEYVKRFPDSPVTGLKIRPLPRLSALTPMYDMLKLFRTGRAHMALLTQPELSYTGEDPEGEGQKDGPAVMGDGHRELAHGPSHGSGSAGSATTTRGGGGSGGAGGGGGGSAAGLGPRPGSYLELARTSSSDCLLAGGSDGSATQGLQHQGHQHGHGQHPRHHPHIGHPGGLPLLGHPSHHPHGHPATVTARTDPEGGGERRVSETAPLLLSAAGGSSSDASDPLGASNPAQGARPPTLGRQLSPFRGGAAGAHAGEEGSILLDVRSGGGGSGGADPLSSPDGALAHGSAAGAAATRATSSSPPPGAPFALLSSQSPPPTWGARAIHSPRAMRPGLGLGASELIGSGSGGGGVRHGGGAGGISGGSGGSGVAGASTSSPQPPWAPPTHAGLASAASEPFLHGHSHTPHGHSPQPSATARADNDNASIDSNDRASGLSRSASAMASFKNMFTWPNRHGKSGASNRSRRESNSSHSYGNSDSDDDDVDDMVPIPQGAPPGTPIGIITIEDVIEELMQFEILDETDKFVDNLQSVLVSDMRPDADLPESLKHVLNMAEAAKVINLKKIISTTLLQGKAVLGIICEHAGEGPEYAPHDLPRHSYSQSVGTVSAAGATGTGGVGASGGGIGGGGGVGSGGSGGGGSYTGSGPTYPTGSSLTGASGLLGTGAGSAGTSGWGAPYRGGEESAVPTGGYLLGGGGGRGAGGSSSAAVAAARQLQGGGGSSAAYAAMQQLRCGSKPAPPAAGAAAGTGAAAAAGGGLVSSAASVVGAGSGAATVGAVGQRVILRPPPQGGSAELFSYLPPAPAAASSLHSTGSPLDGPHAPSGSAKPPRP